MSVLGIGSFGLISEVSQEEACRNLIFEIFKQAGLGSYAVLCGAEKPNNKGQAGGDGRANGRLLLL